MNRKLADLRQVVRDVSAAWQSRCYRLPGRFPNVGDYLDAVGNGLLTAELTRLRRASDAAGEVQLKESKPGTRQIQKLMAIPGDDDEE